MAVCSPAEAGAGEEQPVKLIKMFAEEWKWTPNVIRVAQGTRVRIEFLSYGASRRFDLKAYRLKVRLPQDKPVSVEFVAAVAWLAELFPDPKRREAVLGYTQAFSSL